MADPETTALSASQPGGVNRDDESRLLLSFLQRQRDAVLDIVEGLPEEAWPTPVVPSGWTVAGMLAHLGGAEHHWFQDVTAGGAQEPPPGGEEEAGEYDPSAAFNCSTGKPDYRTLTRQGHISVYEVTAAPGG